MQRDTSLFGAMLLGVVVGLGLVLGGEWYQMRSLAYIGGAVVLGAVGVMTGALMWMDEPESAESSH
jgi:hypothetical protein